MKRVSSPSLALLALTFSTFLNVALAMTRQNVRSGWSRAAPPGDSTIAALTVQNATFEQLIDHENPSLGTFSQFYYYSTEFYKGPGSPVVSVLSNASKNRPASALLLAGFLGC
jgi:hypothetical protein